MTRNVLQLTAPLLLIVSLLALPLSAHAEGETANLVKNGDFEADADGDAKPDHWGKFDKAAWLEEDGNHFARLEMTEPGQTIVMYRGIMLKPEHKVLEVSARVRTNVVKGAANWHDARIVLHFIEDWGGKKLKPSPGAITFKPQTDGWITVKKRITVSDGAKILEFMPSMFQCESGTFDIDDVVITPVTEQ